MFNIIEFGIHYIQFLVWMITKSNDIFSVFLLGLFNDIPKVTLNLQ